MKRTLLAVGFALVLCLSRLPLATPRIVTFDAANFAFALTEFNPSEHKPQPPGYPLYVGLIRLIHLWVDDVAVVFVLAGLIGSLLAVLAVARLGEQMSGWLAGLASGTLLALHPALWTTSLLNPVRVFFAAGSAVVGLFAWRAWQKNSPLRFMLAAWAALGVFSGFRPALLVLLGPVCFWAGVRRRNSARDWLACACVMILPAIANAGISAWAAGGWSSYVALLGSYSDEQFTETSLLFGAAVVPALKMAGRAMIWSLAPVLCWLWLAPFVKWRETWKQIEPVGLFLLLWCGPSLAFITLVHSAEPGHVLPVVVPVCLAGGLMAGLAGRQLDRSRWQSSLAIVAPSAAMSACLFFFPPTNVMRVSSAAAVKVEVDRVLPALRALDEAVKQSPVSVVASSMSSVPWRVLAWYHADLPIVILSPQPPRAGVTYGIFRRGHIESEGNGPVPVLDCGRQVWFLPESAGSPEGVNQLARHGHAMVSTAVSGSTIRVSGFEFVQNRACPSVIPSVTPAEPGFRTF